MVKRAKSKEDPIKIVIKELRKYYYGTKRIKVGKNISDECFHKD